MAIEILMPALSPTMEEGTLAKWLVAEGAEVRSGDVIAEIETDKATMEFEAVDEVLEDLGKVVGDEIVVPTNTTTAILDVNWHKLMAAAGASDPGVQILPVGTRHRGPQLLLSGRWGRRAGETPFTD